MDMETGAIVAVTTHGGAAADTATIQETVVEAGVAVAGLIAEKTPEGNYPVHPGGVKKWWPTRDITATMSPRVWRRWSCEPISRNRIGASATGTGKKRRSRRCTRTGGESRATRQTAATETGREIERNFAHQFDTGGMDRLYVRGRENVHKKLLIQAAACNLALLMRSLYGAGKPRAAHDRAIQAIFGVLALMPAVESLLGHGPPTLTDTESTCGSKTGRRTCRLGTLGGLDTGC